MSREVLLVSKPLAPPWNDGGKVYVRTLVDHLPERALRVLVPRGAPYPAPHVTSEELYGGPGAFRPAIAQNLRVLGRLMRRDRRVALYHFFFAPNPRSSLAARIACRVSRTPSLQTVLSAPASLDSLGRVLFGDRIVVLSDFMRAELGRRGFDSVRIHPGVAGGEPVDRARREAARARLGLGDAPVILYPGDLEFSRAAETVIAAAPAILRAAPEARVVLACRPKTRKAHAVDAALRARAASQPRIVFAGEVQDMRALVAASTLVVLPAETTYAKTDLPLVLLEALAEGVPVVVSDRPPLSEILLDDVGAAVPPCEAEPLAAAVAALLADPVRRARQSARAQALARAHFSGESMARAYEAIYRELLG